MHITILVAKNVYLTVVAKRASYGCCQNMRQGANCASSREQVFRITMLAAICYATLFVIAGGKVAGQISCAGKIQAVDALEDQNKYGKSQTTSAAAQYRLAFWVQQL